MKNDDEYFSMLERDANKNLRFEDIQEINQKIDWCKMEYSNVCSTLRISAINFFFFTSTLLIFSALYANHLFVLAIFITFFTIYKMLKIYRKKILVSRLMWELEMSKKEHAISNYF